MLYVF